MNHEQWQQARATEEDARATAPAEACAARRAGRRARAAADTTGAVEAGVGGKVRAAAEAKPRAGDQEGRPETGSRHVVERVQPKDMTGGRPERRRSEVGRGN